MTVTLLRGVLVGVLSFAVSYANASSYSFTDLGALGGTFSQASGINNTGQIAGVSNSSNAIVAATLWDGPAVTALSTEDSSTAFAVNNSGQVAGSIVVRLPQSGWGTRATVWNGTTMTVLGTLDGTVHSEANAINNSGVVAGRSTIDPYSSRQHATVWNGITPTDLGVDSQANGINDAGQIVGASWNSNGPTGIRAILWNGTSATELDSLGGTNSQAFAINNAGVVVGYSSGIDNVGHATVWNGTSVTDLGIDSVAFAINNAGMVVGVNGKNHASLWNGEEETDLNSFLDASMASEGWDLEYAKGINDMGWIVGDAYNWKLGLVHGFLLKPVPEPESYALVLLGLALICVAGSRKLKPRVPSLM